MLFIPAHAEVKLPRLVRDSMVLQRDTKLNIWGWADKGEKIKVSFLGKTYKTTTGDDGRWLLQLPPQNPGGPWSMEISGTNKIVLKDILVGDVWICGG